MWVQFCQCFFVPMVCVVWLNASGMHHRVSVWAAAHYEFKDFARIHPKTVLLRFCLLLSCVSLDSRRSPPLPHTFTLRDRRFTAHHYAFVGLWRRRRRGCQTSNSRVLQTCIASGPDSGKGLELHPPTTTITATSSKLEG
jgi:hypothetical protein